jgi:hypothetical protein
MRRSPGERAFFIGSVLLAAAPFGFGSIRAMAAGDLRMMWMAVAAFLGFMLVRIVMRDRGRPRSGVAASSFLTLLAAMALAGSTAYLLGATAAVGIWLVALMLALCLAASSALHALSQAH